MIDEGAEALLRSVQPARQFVDLVRAMFTDLWQARLSEAQAAKATLTAQIRDVEGQIEALLDRIVTAASPSVISAYESRIEKLERQKLRLAEQDSNALPPQGRMEEFIEPALTFLSSPWNIYEKVSLALKMTVLKLVFWSRFDTAAKVAVEPPKPPFHSRC